MNKLSIFTLKTLKSLYTKIFYVKDFSKPECEQNPDVASRIIYEHLINDKPCMIARFGSTELATMSNYLRVKNQGKNIWKYITGKENFTWWWEKNLILQMQQWSGFFPPTEEKIELFCELMLEDMKEVNVLGSWLFYEKYFIDDLNCDLVALRLLEPFWSEKPWTKALEGQKVLVVHPFSETILIQYQNRKLLFKNTDVLPEFASLEVIKAIQTLGQNTTEFNDWFEALQWMKDEIDKHDYDVCLIGAGAYGFPLAAHVKRMGKKAVHLGGSLQLVFGIKGKRWEDPNYGVKEWGIPTGSYSGLMNEYWKHPEGTKPTNAQIVEGACYW